MSSDWLTYSVADFIPFSAEVYFSLIGRTGAAMWPLHLLTLAGGAFALALVARRRPRPALVLLAAAWVWVGVTFLMQRYGVLSWAGPYFGWIFVAQAVALLVFAARKGAAASQPLPAGGVRATGVVVAALGLFAYPLIAPLTGGGWLQAETFGIHPDPTAVVTLGICLATLRGGWLWCATIVPGLWCLASGLTLGVLQAPWAGALIALAALALLGPLWSVLAGRRGYAARDRRA